MQRYGKKFISIILCIVMTVGVLSGISITAVAADENVEGGYIASSLFSETFDNITDSTYAPPAAWSDDIVGRSIVTEGDNKYVNFSISNGNNLRSTVNVSGNYVLQYDFKMKNELTGDNVSQNLTFVFRNASNSDKGYISLSQSATGCNISFENVSQENQPVYYKNAETATTQSAYSGDFSVGEWHTLKLVKIGKTLYMNVWKSGSAEPDGYMFKSTSDWWNFDNVQIAAQYTKNCDTAIYLDNISVANLVERSNDDYRYIFNEKFDNITDSTYTPPAQWTDSIVGRSIVTEGDNKCVNFSIGNGNNLRSTVNVSGNYVLQYDFKMTKELTGNATQALSMVFRDANNNDKGYILIEQNPSDGCRVSFMDVSITKHQPVYYKNADVATNQAYTGDFTTEAWYTLKLVKTGKTLCMDIWRQGAAEPAEYTFKTESDLWNYDNIQICYQRTSDFSAALYLDNVFVADLNEPVEEETSVGTPYGGTAPIIEAGKTSIIYAPRKNENIIGEGAGGTVRDDGTYYYIHGDNAGEWWTYTVDVEESGEYKLDVLGSSGYNMSSQEVSGRFSLEIDGEKIVDGKVENSVIMPANGENTSGSNKQLLLFNDDDKIRIGSVYLTAGEHVIKVTVDAVGEVFGTIFHKFYFTHNTEKAGTAWGGTIPTLAGRGTTTIYAARKNENSDGAGSGGVVYDTFGGDNNVEETPQNMDIRGKNEGEWWTYTINVVKPGTYKVGALGSSGYSADGSDNGGRFSLEIDGETVVNGTGENAPVLPAWTDSKPWHEFTEADKIQIGSVSLTTGIHTIKFIVDKPGDTTYGVILSRLYFTPDFVPKSGYSVDGIDGWHIEQGTATVEGDPLSDAARDDVICVAQAGEASLIPNIGSINPIGAVELTVDVYAPNGGSVTLEDAKGRIAGEISLANGVINGTNTAYPVNAWKTLTLLAMSGTKTYEVYDGTTLIASGNVSELASARELHVEATSNGHVYIDNIVLREYIKEDSYTEEELEAVYIPDFSAIAKEGEIGGTDGWTVNQYNNIEGAIANGDNTASANEYELITDPSGENRGTVIRAQRTSDDSDSIVNRMGRSLSADKNLVISMDMYSEGSNNAELQIQLADQTGAENYMTLLSVYKGALYAGGTAINKPALQYAGITENVWHNIKIEVMRETQSVNVYLDNIRLNSFPIIVGYWTSELFSEFTSFALALDHTDDSGIFYIDNLSISSVKEDVSALKNQFIPRTYFVDEISMTEPRDYNMAAELYSVTFRSADEFPSGVPMDNGTVEKVSVKKHSDFPANGARLIVGVYDKTGKMTDVGSCDISAEDFGNEDVATFEFEGIDVNADSVVKAYCLNKTDISPQSESKETAVKTPKKTIYLAGDSLVAYYTDAIRASEISFGIYGWGEVLGNYIDTNSANIVDYAISGSCTRDWFYKIENTFDTNLFDEAKEGDYLLISYGTNDSKYNIYQWADAYDSTETEGAFKNNLLTKFIEPARQKGMIPILITPAAAQHNYGDGRYKRNWVVNWSQAMHELAREENIEIVDLYGTMADYLDTLGSKTNSAPIYIADGLHYSKLGAELCAQLIADGLKQTDCGISEYIK